MTDYKIVNFQDEEYKQFESIAQAEEYRESLHGNDCMDNLRLTRMPFLLNGESVDDETRESIDTEYMNYIMKSDSGCCGFMDEEIFIGNQAYSIGCNFGH